MTTMAGPGASPDFPLHDREALVLASLEWLQAPIADMFAQLKGGNIRDTQSNASRADDLGVLFNANPVAVAVEPPPRVEEDKVPDEAPRALFEALARKVGAYLQGGEDLHRLTLIDQQDYDILVTELGGYKAEIDQQDTALGFLEAHLSHLFGRRLTRDGNPYTLYNLAFFVLEGLSDLEISAGIRRGLLRVFLEQVVPDMQSNLWALANRLEPLAKQTLMSTGYQPLSRHAPGSYYRGEYPSRQPSGPFAGTGHAGAVGPQGPAGGGGHAAGASGAGAWAGVAGAPPGPMEVAAEHKAEKSPHHILEQLLGALESYDRYTLAGGDTAAPAATPQTLARWASAAPVRAEELTLKGVRAASLIQRLPGVVGAEDAAVLNALSPAVMKAVAENQQLITNPDDPLRALLNRAAEIIAAGTAPKETEQLRQWAEAAGRGLLQQPGETRRWLLELDKVGAGALVRRQARVLDLQLELEGWHRMLRARERADETLNRALSGKRLPREAAAFCDGPWRHVLAMIALRHNPGTQVWLDAQNILSDFPQAPLPEDRVNQVRQVIARELQNFFSTVPDEGADLLWLSRLTDPAMGETSMAWANQARAGSGPARQTSDTVDLELGAWVRFADRSDWPYPLQLIWTSLPYGWFGFVDAAGQRSFRMDKAELISHLNRGRVERFAHTSFDKLPPLMDLNIESWAYEDQLLSRLRDQDTGFLNRRGLIQSLTASATVASEKRWQATVIDFPNLAARYANGQHAGDTALAEVSRLLRGLGRPGLMVGRIADSRFVLVSQEGGEQLAQEAHALLSASQDVLGDLRFAIGCCPEAPAGEDVLRFAEQACVAAWEEGTQQIKVSPYLLAQSEDWMRAVTRVMGENRLVPFVQPMRPLRDGLPGHGEVLLRLRADDGSYVSPAIFLREAERQKLITQVDHWVLREVCSWLTRHELPDGLHSLSVNLSGQTLSDVDSLKEIQAILDGSGVKPEKIIFEVTETLAVQDPSQTRQFLSRVRERGCRTALDDFGTGYANYSYLREMPFDYLKVDGSFVRELMQNDSDRALVKSMCEVARGLGMSSIAEFVHDVAMFPLLVDLGVDYAQGYAVSPPVPLASLFESPPQALAAPRLASSGA